MTLRSLGLVLAMVMTALPAAAQDDIIDYSKQDARMNAAMEKGLKTLPAFDAAVARNLRCLLNVRVPYGGDRNEYLWLTRVRRNADGSYDGVVTDIVAHVPDLQQGSLYHARRDQVADWIYADAAGDHGGWTVKLMRERMTPAQLEKDGFHFVD